MIEYSNNRIFNFRTHILFNFVTQLLNYLVLPNRIRLVHNNRLDVFFCNNLRMNYNNIEYFVILGEFDDLILIYIHIYIYVIVKPLMLNWAFHSLPVNDFRSRCPPFSAKLN